MINLLKKEAYLHTASLLFFLFYVPIGYVLNLPRPTIYLTVVLLTVANTFYYERKNKVNVFLKSLPVTTQNIVFTKYTVLVLFLTLFLLYQWLIDWLAHGGLPYLDEQPLNGTSIVFTILGLSIVVSVAVPIFYLFRSFIIASTITLITFFIGAFGFAIAAGNTHFPYIDYVLLGVLYIIDFQPILAPLLLASLCLYASYHVSAIIFRRQDTF
ncbi:ABC-2 transporter permease [Virgibacillus sp. W0181]|uniref:ABC-2 transporter permease n=1 Tax=Virgibacillus sp. W0181 TaxID=3391581 RepID=UPI003F44C74C